MFLSLDPYYHLKKELRRAKAIRAKEDRLFWKKEKRRRKKEKRILTFVTNEICPECGKPVKLEQTVDETDTTDNHYKCTKCAFEFHSYIDDEDFD